MEGILQVITLLLALGDAGVDANKKAPSADAVLAHAVDDADVVVHLDVRAVVPRNYKILVELADDPEVKANPELLATAKQIKANLKGVEGMAKQVAGIDLVNDVSSLTAFLSLGKNGMERMVVARGTFPTDLVDKLAKVAGGKAGSIDGRATLEIDAETFLGTAKDGALIVGPRAWVEPRVDDDWKPSKRKKGSAWATIASRIDDKPFFLAAAKMPEDRAKAVAASIGENFAGDVIAGHELAILSLHADGLALHWKDRSKAGVERMALIAEGAIDLMRAGHVVPRGLAKLMVAALGSYAGKDKRLDAVIARKDDILKIVDAFSGDGKFKVEASTDKKARTYDLRATGKTFSDVVPAAILIPIGALAFVSAGGEKEEASSAPPPKQKAVQPKKKVVPRRSGGGVTAPPRSP